MTSSVVQPDGASRDIARLERYRGQVADLFAVINLTAVSAAAKALRSARERGATVYIAGNGGSATRASHIAIDLMFARGLPAPGWRGIGFADNQSVITDTANGASYNEVYARKLGRLAATGHMLTLVSAPGNSPSVDRIYR